MVSRERAPSQSASAATNGNARHGLVILGRNGKVLHADQVACRLLGQDHSIAPQRSIQQIVPELSPLLAGAAATAAAAGHSAARDGVGEWHRLSVRQSDGHAWVLDVEVECVNLAGRQQILLHLREPISHHAGSAGGDMVRLLQSLESREDMALVLDMDWRVRYANPAFERATGFAREDILGKSPDVLTADHDNGRELTRLQEWVREGGRQSAILVNRKKNGEIYHQETVVRPFQLQSGHITHFVMTGRDISQRIQALEQLEHLAYHDFLTGLPNRALFLDRLRQARAQAARTGNHFALLFLDLDHFKEINDSLGHALGDQVLKAVGQAIASVIREEDSVARLGGDEFACLLAGVADEKSLRLVCEKLLAAARLGIASALPASVHSASISLGVALYPRDGEEESEMLARADEAMYQAKKSGGDRYCWAGRQQLGEHLPGASRVLRWQSAKWL